MSAESDGSIPSQLFKPAWAALLPPVLLRALNAVTYGVTVTEAAGAQHLVYANDAFFALTGYCEEDVADLHGPFLVGSGTDSVVAQEMSVALSEGREVDQVVLSYRRDGSSFFNDLHLAPVRATAGREITHIVGTHKDVTARVEEAAEGPSSCW